MNIPVSMFIRACVCPDTTTNIMYRQTSFIQTAWCPLKCVKIVKHEALYIENDRRLPGSVFRLGGIWIKKVQINEV